jgi:hypothetical protein
LGSDECAGRRRWVDGRRGIRLAPRGFWSATLTLTVFLLGAPVLARAQPPTLTPAQIAILEAMPEDEAPEKLNATRADLEDRHYLMGDELHLNLFYERLKGLGGGYAGVGSDQAYLFMGWMQPEFAWVTDYDPWIKDLHHAYRAFFTRAASLAEFMDLWSTKQTKASHALLAEFYADHPRQKQILNVFSKASWKVGGRLRKLARSMRERGVPSFVSDEAMYRDVRARVVAGRVRPLQCNLLAERCMRGLGEASRQLGVPLRALYFSNAEQYWAYKPSFRANIAAQHFDERSFIVRTIAIKPRNGDYHYNLQPGLNFQRWMAADWVRNHHDVVPFAPVKDETTIPFTVQEEEPEAAQLRRRGKRPK